MAFGAATYEYFRKLLGRTEADLDKMTVKSVCHLVPWGFLYLICKMNSFNYP